MARTKSAKKAHRQSLKRQVVNARRKRTMKDSVKDVATHIKAKQHEAASASLPELYQAIDKAAKRGIINRNHAARMKSRITKRVASLAK